MVRLQTDDLIQTGLLSRGSSTPRLHYALCRIRFAQDPEQKIRISGEKIVQGQRNPTGETIQVKSYYPACSSLPLTGEKWEGGGGVAMAAAGGGGKWMRWR